MNPTDSGHHKKDKSSSRSTPATIDAKPLVFHIFMSVSVHCFVRHASVCAFPLRRPFFHANNNDATKGALTRYLPHRVQDILTMNKTVESEKAYLITKKQSNRQQRAVDPSLLREKQQRSSSLNLTGFLVL
eukprot:scaffold1400_cov175-Amphora_coffeaeformis.AAC.8